jgi:hypothetical protein
VVAAAAVACAVLIALPASAAAGTKSKIATAAGHQAILTATAKCPSGQRATGGGFATPAIALATPFMQVYESRKVGQRSWRASGQIADPGATAKAFTLTAYVYCRDGAPATKSKSATVTSAGVPPLAFFTADAKCSSGKAQAGGFVGPLPNTGGSGSNHFVSDSYRVDKKTWRSRMGSQTPGTPFTSYVYCADEKKPAARSGSAPAPNSLGVATALSAECKRGTKPVAGGFSQPASTPSGGFFLLINESLKTGKRWRVSGIKLGTATLNSIAYCG